MLLTHVIPEPATLHEQHQPRVVRALGVRLDRRMPAAAVWTADLRTGLEAGRVVHDRECSSQPGQDRSYSGESENAKSSALTANVDTPLNNERLLLASPMRQPH